MKNQTPINVPINVGTMPDWDLRFGYPSLTNMFVGASGFCYSTPGLQQILPLLSIRAIYYTLFKGGSYIIVTDNQVIRATQEGTYSVVATITYSGLPVQIDENLQYQVSIVDGLKLYVLDQKTNVFTTIGEEQGFSFKTPCSVVVLNTFTIILDKKTGGWTISDPNNALVYPPLANVPTIESQLTEAMSLATLNTNLYIFGLTGIERWEPNYNTNAFLFPFARDNNFRRDFGVIGTAALKRALDKVYFLSNKYTPMLLTEQQTASIAGDADIGIAKIFSQYPDVSNCICSFYTFRGNYFAHFTFPETAVSWVYCQNSSKFSLGDDLVVGAPDDIEVVATETGIYALSLTVGHKHRQLIVPRIVSYKGQQIYRDVLNGVEIQIAQGKLQTGPQQSIGLSVSIDSMSWLNTVERPIGKTGERNYLSIWNTNIAAYEYTFKFDYYGDYNLSIEKVTAYIN